MPLPEPVKKLIDTYQELNASNLHLLDQVYADDILFEDPAHQVSGLVALRRYFANMYENVDTIRFSFERIETTDNHAYLTWTMTFQHSKLNRGKPIEVEGVSLLEYTDKVIHHRDYFDLGSMVYEHIPLVGSVIGSIKKRLANA